MKELESINSFSGAYAFLSNFEPSPIYYDGFSYPTVEHAFQAAKTLDMTERKTNFTEKQTPGQAKRNGRKVNLRPDWEDVKVPIMYELLLLKFTTHPELARNIYRHHDSSCNWYGSCSQSVMAEIADRDSD